MPEPVASPKLSRYGTFNTWDGLKLLALLLMLIDHAGHFYLTDHLILRALGRGAAPIFLFLTGFAPSHRVKPDLLIGAAVMVASNLAVGGGVFPLSILVSIIMGRLMVAQMDRGKWFRLQRPHEWLIVMIIFAVPSSYLFEDGTFGLMFVLCGYMQRHAERYPAQMRLKVMIFTFLFAALWDSLLFKMPAADALAAFTVVTGVGALLWRIRIRPLALPLPLQWSEPGLRLMSRYTLWIYVLHFCALQLLTGKHF